MTASIGFGTWPLGGKAYGRVEEITAIDSLLEAYNRGIRFYDTADIYGDGRVERLLARAFSGVSDILIATKIGYLKESSSRQDFSPDYLKRSIDASLQRLRRDSVEILLLHSPPQDVLLHGQAIETLRRLREAGVTRKVGVSLRDFSSIRAVFQAPGCEVVELILNLVDQRPLDSQYLSVDKCPNLFVIARLPLCSGFLCGTYTEGHVFPKGDRRHRWRREQIDSWIRAARSFAYLCTPTRSLSQAGIGFCRHALAHGVVIPGMKNVNQVLENTDPLACSISDDEFALARATWPAVAHVVPA